MFMTMLMMLTTLLFSLMKHPMSMGLILLMQTVLVSINLSISSNNSWFSYILYLIMVGGMLILFIYMTSTASNEKFKLNTLMMLMLSLMMVFVMMIIMMNDPLNFETINKINLMSTNSNNLNKFINLPSSLILVQLILYLFITLIATVKITSSNQGALRQLF
uniref:NADH-ubiquinone oxidoreductase chain 6 n=1 Tax=Histeroidea sp. 1 KM-2017 TaxID=2219434 RepID=A0A346RGU0_9COLE|nr:NADH dehydrogenase subunit 6 [Histeroidea sp. 1 KM-2017]